MDYDYDEDLIGEAPCEFCGDLYPLYLLIEHQTSHFSEDYALFENPGAEEINAFFPTATIETAKQNEPQITFAKTQNSPVVEPKSNENTRDLGKPSLESSPATTGGTTETKVAKPKLKEDTTLQPPPQLLAASPTPPESPVKNTFTKPDQFKKNLTSVEEFTTNKGEKLLVYGANIEPVDELESEKQDYKMPNNPLLSDIPKEEDVEDINNLSDDDCDESLEEFWKRARDFLKRSRGKIEC